MSRPAASLLICLLACLALSGCAGSQVRSVGAGSHVPDDAPLVAPRDGHGRIYFYRTDLPVAVALSPEVIVNGREVGRAAYDTVFYRDARPGRYEVFLASDPDHPIYITIRAGELRFVKAAFDLDWGGTRLTAELVDEELGRREIAEQRRVRTAEPRPRHQPE